MRTSYWLPLVMLANCAPTTPTTPTPPTNTKVQHAPAGGFQIVARFRDARGLSKGSLVTIAGLPVGKVETIGLDGRYAKISMSLRAGLPLYTNATVTRLNHGGESYVDIDPGTASRVGPKRVSNRRLHSGGEIVRVLEAVAERNAVLRTEQVMRSLKDLIEDLRRITNGPLLDSLRRGSK